MRDARLTRRRLLQLGGSGMVAVALPWLPACGGGSKSGSTPGGTGFEGAGLPGAGAPGAAVSPPQRVAALDAVAAAIVPATPGVPAFDSLALATALRASPAFQRVGISTDRQNVWALFTDGRPLVIPNNLVPGAGAASGLTVAGAPAAAGRLRAAPPIGTAATSGNLPSLLTRQQYRQLDMFGLVPVGSALESRHLCGDFVSHETLPRLRTLAVGRGFTLPYVQIDQPPDLGHDNGVEGLRGVSEDGVFFINAAAAEIGGGTAPRNVICVDTDASEANEALYADDLAAGRLVYAVTLAGIGGDWVPRKCLAITPEFAAANWTFPVECLGILNLTGGWILSDWGNVLDRCGLRNVVTWGRPVSWQRMLAFADDLLNLLLATNALYGTLVTQPVEPRLRAYGVGETLSYLANRGLTADAGGVNQIVFMPSHVSAELVDTLVPTISYVNIDEAQAIIEVNGEFGYQWDGGRESQVRFGASPPSAFSEPLLEQAADGPLPGIDALRLLRWDGDLIKSDTERAALMGGGYLQVVNLGRCSNAVQITHWRIPMHLVTTITGGLTLDATITLHLRADVRGHRMRPDGQRGNTRWVFPLATTAQSRADYEASGEISQTTVDGVTTTITWSGGGSVVNELLVAMRVTATGIFYLDSRTLRFGLTVAGGATYDERKVVTRGAEVVSDTTTPATAALSAALKSDGTPLELHFSTHDWKLLAGNVTLHEEPVSLLGQRVRTATLTWGEVAPDFPPEETVGGV